MNSTQLFCQFCIIIISHYILVIHAFILLEHTTNYSYSYNSKKNTKSSIITFDKKLTLPVVHLLSNDKYLENDLVSIYLPIEYESIIIGDDDIHKSDNDVVDKDDNNGKNIIKNKDDKCTSPILCVVRPDGGIHPLCIHEDDNENDLFIHPKLAYLPWWTEQDINDNDIVGIFGEGWYGQRVVPSLGGGPGYGASADDVWTVDEDVLEKVKRDGVIIPVLDLGIAHGEKARGGAI